MSLEGIVTLRKRLQSQDPEAYRRRMMPVFRAALSRAHEAFASGLASRGVGSFSDTIASGALLRSFNLQANQAVEVTASRLYFYLRLRHRAPTAELGDPAEYFQKLDEDSGSAWDIPSLPRILRWMKQRGIDQGQGANGKIPWGRGRRTRMVPVKAVAAMIRVSIINKARSGAYRPLHLSRDMIAATGIQDPGSDLRRSIHGLSIIQG